MLWVIGLSIIAFGAFVASAYFVGKRAGYRERLTEDLYIIQRVTEEDAKIDAETEARIKHVALPRDTDDFSQANLRALYLRGRKFN